MSSLAKPAPRRRKGRAPVARIGAAQDRVKQQRVLDRPRERSDGLEICKNCRQSVGARPAADRWLVADKASMTGGAPDRAAAIRAERGGDKTRRNARRRAAARASRREFGIPWVARDAEQIVARIALERELRRVRFANDDHSRLPEPRHGQFVLRWPVVLERAASPCRWKARDMEVVLDRDRNAVEPRMSLAPRATRITVVRRGKRS